MKLVNITINWNDGWDTQPDFKVQFDKSIIGAELVYEERQGFYLAVNGDYASFFYYNSPGNGFGGSQFTLTMKDGSTRVLQGPWSSSSGQVNLVFPESKVTEVIAEGCACACRADALIEICKQQGIDTAWVEYLDNEYYLQPLRDGEPKVRAGMKKEYYLDGEVWKKIK